MILWLTQDKGATDGAFRTPFWRLLLFVYHCFDRLVIHGYLSGLSRPEQVVYFFREVVGVPAITKELLSRRTIEYQSWVEAFARNRHLPSNGRRQGCASKTICSSPCVV